MKEMKVWHWPSLLSTNDLTVGSCMIDNNVSGSLSLLPVWPSSCTLIAFGCMLGSRVIENSTKNAAALELRTPFMYLRALRSAVHWTTTAYKFYCLIVVYTSHSRFSAALHLKPESRNMDYRARHSHLNSGKKKERKDMLPTICISDSHGTGPWGYHT